ncbi:MAG: hypothetical protein IJ192_05155 [Clostridia bacterium]|nr:hypothetical protein [Clostridia bacterium]
MKVVQRITSVAVVYLLSFIFLFWGEICASAYTAINVEIPVTCLEISDDYSYIYEIRIETENENAPAPNFDILEIKENGMGTFEINITEPGTFNYKIYENTGSVPNIRYDSNVYIVTVFVENDANGELTYSVTARINGNDNKIDGIKFENAILEESSTVLESSSTDLEESSTVTSTDSETTTSNNKNSITKFILTGDSTPARVTGLTILSVVMIAISVFLFKRKESEEEEKNEK